MPTVAVTSTFAMVQAAEARGVDTTPVLAAAGITRAQLEDPDGRLPYALVMETWDALRSLSDDCALQLAAPLTLPWGTYRVIDYLVTASATVGEGVSRFARFFGLIADAVQLAIEESGEGYWLQIQLVDGGAVPPVHVDYTFAALVSRIRLRMRPEFSPRCVELRQPPPENEAPYLEFFRAPVQFRAACDRLCFSAEEWHAAALHADAELARLMEVHARMLDQRSAPPAGYRRDVERAITATLADGAAIEDVARALHVSVRTLQRRLDEAATTFRDVSEAVRAQLAREYLADPKVGIAEVAFLLGFSDQSSFSRAFSRWTGETPGRWRRSLVAK